MYGRSLLYVSFPHQKVSCLFSHQTFHVEGDMTFHVIYHIKWCMPYDITELFF